VNPRVRPVFPVPSLFDPPQTVIFGVTAPTPTLPVGFQFRDLPHSSFDGLVHRRLPFSPRQSLPTSACSNLVSLTHFLSPIPTPFHPNPDMCFMDPLTAFGFSSKNQLVGVPLMSYPFHVFGTARSPVWFLVFFWDLSPNFLLARFRHPFFQTQSPNPSFSISPHVLLSDLTKLIFLLVL